MTIKPFTTCLWFDTEAEEAARFYVSVFKDGKLGRTTYYGEAGPGPAGQVFVVEFEINGQAFIALNGGPQFKFDEAISFQIYCEDQAEIDHYWSALLAGGGSESACGWLKDRFGLSWQVAATRFFELVDDPDPAKVARVTKAMLGMVKMDVAALEKAYQG